MTREMMSRPKLHATNWNAPGQQDQRHLRDTGNISPRSQSGIPLHHDDDDGLTEQSAKLAADELEDEGTTPVPPPKPTVMADGFTEGGLEQLRKIIRAEFLNALGHSQGSNRPEVVPIGSSLSNNVESMTSSRRPSSATATTPPSSKPSSPEFESARSFGVRLSNRGLHKNFVRRTSAFIPDSDVNAAWGVLFDEGGYATERLGQFLRGLADYFIFEVNPKHSLVITPDKLATFYAQYKINQEAFPLAEILSSRARELDARLGDFYYDLDCQYHLIQATSKTRPTIPGLTALGFSQYLTTCILAYPDEEFKRLQAIAYDLSVWAGGRSTSDDKLEKFPREITRDRLPALPDPKSRSLLIGAVRDLMVDLNIASSPPRSPASSTASLGSNTSRASRRRYVPGRLHTINDISPSRNREQPEEQPTKSSTRSIESDVRQTGSKFHDPRHISPIQTRFPRGDLSMEEDNESPKTTSTPPLPYHHVYNPPPPPIGEHSPITSSPLAQRRARSPRPSLHTHSVSDTNVSGARDIPRASAATRASARRSSTTYAPSSISSSGLSMSMSPQYEHGNFGSRGKAPSSPAERRASMGYNAAPGSPTVVNLQERYGSAQSQSPTRTIPRKGSWERRSTTESSEDDRGQTWGEYLRSQKQAGKGGHNGGGSHQPV